MSKELTIIIGTNRANSNSAKIAAHYKEIAVSKGAKAHVINLEDVPHTIAFSELYGNRSEEFQSLIQSKISSVDKFVFIIPEYNGGFPGVLKTFIDAVPPADWANKKAGMIGLSSGRGGAARAMDQFTNVLNYLKVNVLFSKPKLSGIADLLSEDGSEIQDDISLRLLDNHVEDMLDF